MLNLRTVVECVWVCVSTQDNPRSNQWLAYPDSRGQFKAKADAFFFISVCVSRFVRQYGSCDLLSQLLLAAPLGLAYEQRMRISVPSQRAIAYGRTSVHSDTC